MIIAFKCFAYSVQFSAYLSYQLNKIIFAAFNRKEKQRFEKSKVVQEMAEYNTTYRGISVNGWIEDYLLVKKPLMID
jgi:hypothetical protein